MKKVTVLSFGLSVAVALSIGLTGCGGGGGGGDTIYGNGLAIIYHYPADVCLSPELEDYLNTVVPEAQNLDISVASNEVTCATYNKTEGIDCVTDDFALVNPDPNPYDVNTSCVIGFDYVYYTKQLSVNEDIALEAIYSTEAVR